MEAFPEEDFLRDWLIRIVRAFPAGFYFKDLSDPAPVNWSAIVQAEDPLILHLQMSAVSDVVSNLIEHGLAPSTPAAAVFPKHAPIIGTTTDIATRLKRIATNNLILIIHEGVDGINELLSE